MAHTEAPSPRSSAGERLAGFESVCRAVARDLIARLLPAEHVEFVDAFATPFPLRALCAFLGWPEQLWECLGGWTHGSQLAAFTPEPAAGKALARLFTEHVTANLRRPSRLHGGYRRRHRPVAGDVGRGPPLDDEQSVSVLRNWTAGHGTVSAALSVVVLHLAQQPALQQRLRADPWLIPAAIEEILRSDDPLVAN